MKRKLQFLYPAIFVKDEDGTYQVVFPDLDLSVDGKNLSEAYLKAKDLLYVYFNYAIKYDTEFNQPTKFEVLSGKCRANETVMYVDAVLDTMIDE